MGYDAAMKYVLALLLSLVLVVPVHAGDKEEALLRGLLNLGAQAAMQATQPAEAEPGQAAATQKRNQGRDMLAAVSSTLDGKLGHSFSAVAKEQLDALINEYKEEYKAEGRAYAKELGDMMVERVIESPKVSSTITSVKALCWGVIVYLTLVTLIMLGLLVYLKRANARLLEEVRRMARSAQG